MRSKTSRCWPVLMIGATAAATLGTARAESIGPYAIEATPISAVLVSGGGPSFNWLNVIDEPVSIDQAFTGFSVIDDGYADAQAGTILQMTFASGTLRNGPKADLVLLDAGNEVNYYLVTTSHDGFVQQVGVVANSDTGVDRSYYLGGQGPTATDIFAVTIDLSWIGVPDEQTVDQVRLRTGVPANDPLGLGVLSRPGPLPPTACCRPDGSCEEATEPAICEASGGLPKGVCSTCFDTACPAPGCVGAVGSCTVPHATPGCADLFCCNQICLNRPECCSGPWDATCAAQLCFVFQFVATGCVPGGSCQSFWDPRLCYNAGAVPCSGDAFCEGDADADGIDEGCPCDVIHPYSVPPTMRVGKSVQPGYLDVFYPVTPCNASNHVLLFGRFPDFNTVTYSECSIGNDGTHTTQPPEGLDPQAGDVWFVVAGLEGDRRSSLGQSSWGERYFDGPTCGNHDPTATCP